MKHTIDLLSDCSERVPYNVADFPVYACQSFLSGMRDMGAASHWHDDLEIGVVLSGYMTYAVNGTHLRVNSGEGLFINARQLHSNFSADGSDCEYLCVLLHPSLLCATPFVEAEYVTPILRNGGFVCASLRPDVPWQAALMRTVVQIEAAFREKGGTFALTVQALAMQVAALLYEHMPAADPLSPEVDRRLAVLRNMVGFVQLHYDEKITLPDIAAAGSVSVSRCCAIFRQQLGQTPMGYLSRYRVEKALALLENPDLSMIHVALAVGFSSASYFTETFHRFLGLTPSAYRARKSGRNEKAAPA